MIFSSRTTNNRVFSTLAIVFISFVTPISNAKEHQSDAAPQITLGNGEKSWIIVDDLKRDESTLTFSEVNIDGAGFLVMHPFEDGKPNGDKYVASSYLKNGKNTNVDIKVHKGMTSGEPFIVMLHRDLNDNKVLDFVFVDDTNVMDKAVFEGSRMVAHIIKAP
jgi:hypothetical protein